LSTLRAGIRFEGARDVSSSSVLAGVVLLSALTLTALSGVFALVSGGEERHRSSARWVQLMASFGNGAVLAAVTLAVLAALALSGRRPEARFFLLASVGTAFAVYAIKIVLQLLGADHDGGRLADFPSGHVAGTIALLGAAAVLLSTRFRKGARIAAGIGVGAAGLVMAAARVASGSHTVLDVVGGAVLAVGWLALTLLVAPPSSPRS
jgi:membrane-associated phospholipid phosphatase